MGIGDPPSYVGEVNSLPSPPSAGTVVLIGFGGGVEVEVGNKPRISSIALLGFGGGDAEVVGTGDWAVGVGSVAGEFPKISSSRFWVFEAATWGIPVEFEGGLTMSSPPRRSPP